MREAAVLADAVVRKRVEYARLPLEQGRPSIGKRGALRQRVQLVLAAECLPPSSEQRIDDQPADGKREHQKEPGERRLRAAVLQNEEHCDAQRVQTRHHRQQLKPGPIRVHDTRCYRCIVL
jgi:hypothetical protein